MRRTDREIKEKAAIMAHYSDRKFEFPHKGLEQTTVIRIDIREMTGKQTRQ